MHFINKNFTEENIRISFDLDDTLVNLMEPTLEFIDDDAEYEMVAEAFDEYLDQSEFDEIVEE